MRSPVRLVVIAKAPVPGRSKTRLCPPLTPDGAARVAEAALADTLASVAATPCRERVLALEGEAGPWLPRGFRVVPQRGDELGSRLGAAIADARAPALVIGMDTPQVTPALLEASLESLVAPGVDAVLGAAEDGGYWAIGLTRADPTVFTGVPMSSAGTHAAQAARLDALGLSWRALPVVRDCDHLDDARAVASAAPGSRFASALAAVLA